MRFKSSGHRAIEAGAWHQAAETFALMKARRAYGREAGARVVMIDNFGLPSGYVEVEAFIGLSTKPGEVIGRNVRFTVRQA
jgi:hypothetical protein